MLGCFYIIWAFTFEQSLEMAVIVVDFIYTFMYISNNQSTDVGNGSKRLLIESTSSIAL